MNIERLVFFLVMISCMSLAIMPAIAADYILDIFGNANLDEDIDEMDIAYVKGIINGTNVATNLSDANYDGKIDALDIDQIKLIILGGEKELTLTDCTGKILVVKEPVDRVISTEQITTEILKAIGMNKVVGTDCDMWGGKAFLPELDTLPCVGSYNDPDGEAIIKLDPDVVFVYSTKCAPGLEDKLAPAGIPVVRVDTGGVRIDGDLAVKEWKKIGYIIHERARVEELIDWYEGHLKEIESRTAGLSDKDRRQVYAAFLIGSEDRILGINRYLGYACTLAGGVNIAGDVNYGTIADPEWVIVQNPDFIVLATTASGAIGGYETDDPTAMKEQREIFLNRTAWQNVTAVKDGKVAMTAWHMLGGPHMLIATAYMAKWFYPDLFEDLDPEAIHKEYLQKFQKLDYDLDEHGVFAYPALETGVGLAGIPDRKG